MSVLFKPFTEALIGRKLSSGAVRRMCLARLGRSLVAERKEPKVLTLRWRKEDSNPRSPVYGELGAPEPRATRPTRQREAPEHAGVIFLELWCSPVLRCAEIFFRG